MSAFDRFLAGEDRLSALLKSLPLYDTPDTLAASVLTAAAQSEGALWNVANLAVAPAFEPSPALAEAVLHEAKQMEAAQALRREALWNSLENASPAEALGAPVTAATETWLRQQQLEHAKTSTQKPAHKPQRRWWTLPRIAFGFSCGLALFFGFAMQRTEVTPTQQAYETELASATEAAQAAPAAEVADTEYAPPPSVQTAAAAPSEHEQNKAYAAKAVMPEADYAAKPRADKGYRAAPRGAASEEKISPLANARIAAAEPVPLPPPPAAIAPTIAPLAEAEFAAPPPPSSVAMESKRSMARSVAQTYTYLIHDAQWQQLADSWVSARQDMARAKADIADAANASAPITWYLEAADIETEDIRALAAQLRASLPSGVNLVVRAQAEVPGGYARLLR